MASLLHHPSTLHSLGSVNPDWPEKKSIEQLKNQRYKLSDYLDVNGKLRYGLVPVTKSENLDKHATSPNKLHQSLPNARVTQIRSKLWWSKALEHTIFTLTLIGLAMVIMAHYRDVDDDGFNRFFNSNSFGPRLVLTGAATLISWQWSRLEKGELIQITNCD